MELRINRLRINRTQPVFQFVSLHNLISLILKYLVLGIMLQFETQYEAAVESFCVDLLKAVEVIGI